MRLFLVLAALSTLAAAGPLPPFSKSALETRAWPSTPANNTLGSDPVEALTKLKAVYDSLNAPQPSGSLKIKRDFWTWLKDAFEAPGLKARSSNSTSTPDDEGLSSDLVATSSDLVATLSKLKAIYDNLNQKRMESGLKTKRDFWTWLKDAFEAPGLKARSSNSTSTPDNNELGSDPVAALTKLKAVYDSLNEKRVESGLKTKRDFWTWLKDAFEAPGLKARSIADHTPINGNPDEPYEIRRGSVQV